jgi:hypothetical protein
MGLFNKFTYDISPKIPYGYYCCKCKTKGMRLWRDINDKLYCLECGVEYQRKYHESLDEIWIPEYNGCKGCGVRIGWLVPAIPLAYGFRGWLRPPNKCNVWEQLENEAWDWWNSLKEFGKDKVGWLERMLTEFKTKQKENTIERRLDDKEFWGEDGDWDD